MVRTWKINGRFLTQSITGVQRYAHEILRALDQHLTDRHNLARDLDVELIVPEGVPSLPGLRSIATRVTGGSAGRGHMWEQLILPAHARGGLISLCNTGPLAARKQIVCIHDVNTRACPGSYSLQFRALYRMLLPALGRTARRIVTVSNYSADALKKYGIATENMILVAPDGHEHALRWQPRHSPATRYAAGPSTVVIIGSPAPHKNVGIILGMAQNLAEAGLRIAVAGMSDDGVFRASHFGPVAGDVVWLGRVSDEELAALLRDSLCLAFPSLAEGFGLPALEAMAMQCPVVVSDRASLPEICGDAALYASPADGAAWLDCFLRLRADPKLRADLIARGRSRALLFSWNRTAELYLETMARMDGMCIEGDAVLSEQRSIGEDRRR